MKSTRTLIAALILSLVAMPFPALADEPLADTQTTIATISFADTGTLRFSVAPTSSISLGTNLALPTGAVSLASASDLSFSVKDDRLVTMPWDIKANITNFAGSVDETNTFGGFMHLEKVSVNGITPSGTSFETLDGAHPGLSLVPLNANMGCGQPQKSLIAYTGTSVYRGDYNFKFAASDADKFYFRLPATELNKIKQKTYNATITWTLSTGP